MQNHESDENLKRRFAGTVLKNLVSESILTCVKNEDIIDYTFLSIAFTTAKSDQKLAELSR